MSLEKYYSGFRIQEGSADEVERDDKTVSGDSNWRTVASGANLLEAVLNFIEAINEDEVITENNFYRLVSNQDIVLDGVTGYIPKS